MKRTSNHLSTSALINAILFNCLIAATVSQGQSFKCFVLNPPEQVLDSVKTVAIVDFGLTTRYASDGRPTSGKVGSLDKILGTIEKVADAKKGQNYFPDSGKKLADLVVAALLEEDRGIKEVGSGFLGLGKKEGKSFQQTARTNVFTVVERTRMDQVMQELQLGQTGLVDEAQAAQVGRMLGADAIITGNVGVSCEDEWVKEKRTEKKKTVEVNCEKRTANVSASVRITHVETGRLMGSKEASHKQELKKCEGDFGAALPPPEATVDVCLQAVAAELVNYFAPRFVQQKMELVEAEGPDFKRYLDAAEDAIDRYDLDTAYLQYTAMAEKDPYNAAVIYNLGVLNEAVSNFSKAQQLYGMAAKLQSTESRYTKAQSRVAKQVVFWEKLQVLGLDLQEYDFNVSADQVKSATAKKILINGKNSDRFEVKAGPDLNSETLVRVPGGIELEVVDSGGEWYKIRLLDGRDGYFLKRNAKFIK